MLVLSCRSAVTESQEARSEEQERELARRRLDTFGTLFESLTVEARLLR